MSAADFPDGPVPGQAPAPGFNAPPPPPQSTFPGLGHGAYIPPGTLFPPPPPPRPRRRYRRAIVVSLAAVVVLSGASVVASLASAGDTSSDERADTTASPTTAEITGPTIVAMPTQSQCLPNDFTAFGTGEFTEADPGVLVVPCEDPTAFWSVAWADDTVTGTVDANGMIDPATLPQPCTGDTVEDEIGVPWRSLMTDYDPDTQALNFVACLEAIDRPDEQGRTPVEPDVGDCAEQDGDSGAFWTVECPDSGPRLEVVGIFNLDDPDATEDELVALAGTQCPGVSALSTITDAAGNAIAVRCFTATE